MYNAMYICYFNISALVFEIQSEDKLNCGPYFENFICKKTEPDFCVKITKGKVPCLDNFNFVNSTFGRKYFTDNGEAYVFNHRIGYGNRVTSCRYIYGRRIEITIDYPDKLWDTSIFDAMNLPEILVNENRTIFHSSFILNDGKAILFSGDKGAGKSTQARLWEKYTDSEIINGDRTILHFNGERLIAYGTPYCGSSNIALNKSAEVQTIVFLQQAQSNSIELCRKGYNLFCDILSQCSFENNQLEPITALVEKICVNTPVYTLKCKPDFSAVETLRNKLCTNKL